MYDHGLAPTFRWGLDVRDGYHIDRQHPQLAAMYVTEQHVPMDGYYVPEQRLLELFETIVTAGHRARL
jgi:hypothetical protein